MLSRTASNLFWMARYMERADYVARLLQVAQRMSTISPASTNEWQSALIAAGCEPAFLKRYDMADAANVVDFLTYDQANPSSIYSCLKTARENARAVRTGISADMWDAVNGTWIELRQFHRSDFTLARLPAFISWTKQRGALFMGAYTNTMMRGESYEFTELGSYLERADNTARILDVKYHVLLPVTDQVGGLLDYYQWAAILQSVSALRAYHRIYDGQLKPFQISELLILRPELPRSLRFSTMQLAALLGALSHKYGGQSGECHRHAGVLQARLQYGRVQDIFDSGLHEFLTDFVEEIADLGNEISDYYLV